MKSLIILILSICLSSFSCSKPADYSAGANENDGDKPTQGSISYLRSLYRGSSHKIAEHCVIEGWISANDRFGEFSQMLIIDDGQSAIPVLVEGEDLFLKFPFASKVSLNCDDLAFATTGGEYGTLVLCAQIPQNDELEAIKQEDIPFRLQNLSESQEREYSSLRTASFDAQMVSRTYNLRSVRFVDTEDNAFFLKRDEETSRLVSTRRSLEFEDGTRCEIFFPSSIEYGEAPLPEGRLNILVCVERYINSYSVRPTDFRFQQLN